MTGRFLTLLLVTIMAGVAAVVVLRADRGDLAPGHEGRALFPGLMDKVNDVRNLRITTVDGHLTIRAEEDGWVVDELGGYPADADVVKGLVVGLAGLALAEPKTRRSDRYPKLGVEGPDRAEEGSLSLRLVLSSGTSDVADVILGNAAPGLPGGLYVRKGRDEQSWLARGDLQPPRSAVDCVDASLFDVGLDRLARVVLEHADGEVVTIARASREDTTWRLQDLPEGLEPTYEGIGRTIAAFPSRLTLESVLRAEEAPLPAETSVATFTAFDGLVITVAFARVEERTRATFRFGIDQAIVAETAAPADEGDEDNTTDGVAAAVSETVRAEAEALDARLAPWVFVLPEWKSDNIEKRLADLTKATDPPADPAPEPATGDADGG
jgi:hypothetical protein